MLQLGPKEWWRGTKRGLWLPDVELQCSILKKKSKFKYKKYRPLKNEWHYSEFQSINQDLISILCTKYKNFQYIQKSIWYKNDIYNKDEYRGVIGRPIRPVNDYS